MQKWKQRATNEHAVINYHTKYTFRVKYYIPSVTCCYGSCMMTTYCHTCLWHPLAVQSLHRGWQSSQHKQCSSMETAVRNKHTLLQYFAREKLVLSFFSLVFNCGWASVLWSYTKCVVTTARLLSASFGQYHNLYVLLEKVAKFAALSRRVHFSLTTRLPSYMDLKCSLYLQFLITCSMQKRKEK